MGIPFAATQGSIGAPLWSVRRESPQESEATVQTPDAWFKRIGTDISLGTGKPAESRLDGKNSLALYFCPK